MSMNKNSLVGLALVALAVVGLAFVSGAVGDYAAKFIGKAVWYLPYAAFVSGVRLLVRA